MVDQNMVLKKSKKYKFIKFFRKNLYLKFYYSSYYFSLSIKDFFTFKYKNKKSQNFDAVLQSSFLQFFRNLLLKNGNVSHADKLLFLFLKELKQYLHYNKVSLFKNYLLYFILITKLIQVAFNIKNVRIGGRVYLVPFLVKFKNQQHNSLNILKNTFFSLDKKSLNFFYKFKDFFNLLDFKSSLNKVIVDFYKSAYDNRAFSHYRWF
jgi:hypothetical protein